MQFEGILIRGPAGFTLDESMKREVARQFDRMMEASPRHVIEAGVGVDAQLDRLTGFSRMGLSWCFLRRSILRDPPPPDKPMSCSKLTTSFLTKCAFTFAH